MATNKNITMKQFNGTDYDTLYPKTIASQVDNVYNKEEVISGATKTLYGLGSNATPDNAFKKISDKISNGLNELSKIGDIMITARKDLGDKWLLCNGDEISPSVYPELAEIIKGESLQQLSSTLSIRLYDVAVYNGIWVAVGTAKDNETYIFTTTDPTGTWTGKQLETKTINSMKIACYNGTWVAVGCTYGASFYPYIYTTTNPTGTWTGKQISTASVSQIGGIACYNGTWVIAGMSDNYYPKIYTSTNPSGAWTEAQISNNQTYIQDITCYNGTWVAVGYTFSVDYPYIYTTTNPTGTWTGKQLSSTIAICLKAVSCYNGTWVAVGYTSNVSNARPYIYTTTTPTGTWSGKYIDSQTAYFNPYGIACCNGNWVMVGISRNNNNTIIYTATQPSGAWAKRIIFSTNIDLYGIESDGDTWVTCGCAGSPFYPWVGSNDYYLLPTISPDRSYAYIKALE